jgi:5-(carboxyamino)imidazole ribonucleotide synthase
MVNLLGYETGTQAYLAQRQQLAQWGKVYWYGKTQSRPGRKLGHITLRDCHPQEIKSWVDRIESLWSGGANQVNLIE